MNPSNFRLNLEGNSLRIRWTETITRRDVVTGAVETKAEECFVLLPEDVTAIAADILAPARGLIQKPKGK